MRKPIHHEKPEQKMGGSPSLIFFGICIGFFIGIFVSMFNLYPIYDMRSPVMGCMDKFSDTSDKVVLNQTQESTNNSNISYGNTSFVASTKSSSSSESNVSSGLAPIDSSSSNGNAGFVASTNSSNGHGSVPASRSNRTQISEIFVPTNPHGAETLPPDIIVPQTDLYLRRLWGKPTEDLPSKPRYLVTFTVGIEQMEIIDAAVKKFSENFTVMLFHYDGNTTEWDELEWSKHAVHVSARKQTKWWFAKRFLHPDVVAPYEYIFMWDEDLGVEHFNAEEYLKVVRKHGLEISQPALDPSSRGLTWQMTRRRGDGEVHRDAKENNWTCSDSNSPPCAAFVEIMAPVFSRKAWRCVWHMIQNDLVHGWGLDFALKKCVAEPAEDRIGVVDSQWIVHRGIPSLGRQGQSLQGRTPREGVKERCYYEWAQFKTRLAEAEKKYLAGKTAVQV